MNFALVTEYVNQGNYTELYDLIKITKFPNDITPGEMTTIYKDIIKKIVISDNFACIEIYRLSSIICDRLNYNTYEFNAEKLVDYMLTDDMESFINSIKNLRSIKFNYQFNHILHAIIKSWYENHLTNFQYIRNLCSDDLTIFELFDPIKFFLLYGDVDATINFVSYCGFDIDTIHLEKDLHLLHFDLFDYQDIFGKKKKKCFDQIYNYAKSQRRIKFFTQFILNQWASQTGQCQCADEEFIKELYIELDTETRNVVISYALAGYNIHAIELITKCEDNIISLTSDHITIILDAAKNDVNEKIKKQQSLIKYIETIMKHTDFINKITKLPTESELNSRAIVIIVKEINANKNTFVI